MRAVAVAGLLLAPYLAFGQQHVAFAIGAPAAVRPGGAVLVPVTARIDSGWHLYAASSGGGIPISFHSDAPAVAGLRLLEPAPRRAYDANLQANTDIYEGQAAFLVALTLRPDVPAGPLSVPLRARYQTCSDTQCIPGNWTGSVALTVDPSASAAAPAIPAGYSEGHPPPPASDSAAVDQAAWGFFLVTAFGLGLACIFTPCVFPMIPITMSYFLNRPAGGRRDSIVHATVFCLGIVVLFSGIGLTATAILGPAGVKDLGGNPWVNGFIAVLFFAFSLSLLGAFEITVPSSILTRLNESSGKGGFTGTLIMGLAFSLSSFACVGPFVGTLLAASVSGGALRPLVGMVTFAAGLALPFFLLALFPGYLKRMPRSGGWLARVKVVMGFVIMAASLKYFSSADQVLHWDLLTRDRFLAAWVVLFAMAGLYLLGFVRLEGVKPEDRMGLGRLLCGIAFLVFSLSLIPGMFGARLGELDAYIPEPQSTAGVAGTAAPSADGLVWLKDRYQDALAQARSQGKLVFIDFTGYACTNCHWMRANMLSRPEIAAELKNFVLVELYTDGDDAASKANNAMQAARFGTVAEPFYVIEDADEKVIATFDHLTKDPGEYLSFLEKGVNAGAPPAEVAAAAPPASIPSGIPNVTTLAGGRIDAAAFSGKVVVVNFWATYCVPCIEEIPSFNKVSQEYAGRVAVIGVSMDEDASPVPGFLKKHPMDYQVAMGSPDLSGPYGLDGLPVTLVLDKSGKPVKRFVGFLKEDQLEAAIHAAL